MCVLFINRLHDGGPPSYRRTISLCLERNGFCCGLGAPWASWRGHRGLPSLLLIHGERAEGWEREFCFYSSTSDAGDDSTGDEETKVQKDEVAVRW